MKVFQILNGYCYWDATSKHPESVENAFDKYQDALAALALLDIYPEEVTDDE